MSIYSRIIGHPWVFEHLRPLLIGGIDMSPGYQRLACDEHSLVLDVGCGGGDALEYLPPVHGYLGVDTDPRAIAAARRRHAERAATRFECRSVTSEDFRWATHVAMIGLLHHLSNAQALALLRQLAAAPRLACAVTLDVVYLPLRPWNNLLAFADRGRFCRSADGYLELIRTSGLDVLDQFCVGANPRSDRVQYFVTQLGPRRTLAGT